MSQTDSIITQGLGAGGSLITQGLADTGALAVAAHPDFIVVWKEALPRYLVGEKRPLKWQVTRLDGQTVSLPTAGSISVTLPDGSTRPLTPDLESADVSAILTVAADCLFDQAGGYKAALLLTIENQVVGHELLLLAS